MLAGRWSPASFDAQREVEAGEVEALLEAARWAPSAGNSQPWAFLVGRRGDADHARLMSHVAGSARRLAATCGLLVANLSHRFVEGTDWEYSEFAAYDLGQAVAHMSVQALAMDLHMRQFRAFDRQALALEFDVPAHWEVTTMSAIGHVAPDGRGDAAPGDQPARSRRDAADLRWPQAAQDVRPPGQRSATIRRRGTPAGPDGSASPA